MTHMMRLLQLIDVALLVKRSIDDTILYVKHWAYLHDQGRVSSCDHAVCLDCINKYQTTNGEVMPSSYCDHVMVAPPPPDTHQPPEPSPNPSDGIATALNKLADVQATTAQALAAALRGGRRATLKTVTMLDFAKGSDKASEDLPRWLADFKRVADHVSGGKGLPTKDLVIHLRACWPPNAPGEPGHAGESMRLDQDIKVFKQMEDVGDFAGCWAMLVNTLNKYAVPAARARRKAQAMWSDLAWPQDGGIRAFHTSLRQALMACDRQSVAKAEHDVIMRYLELIPRECAIILEDPLRVPKQHGWTLEPLLKEADEYFEIRKAYPVKDDGLLRIGAGPQRRVILEPQTAPSPNHLQQAIQQGITRQSPQQVQQGATWDNNREMMQAPLTASWKPDTKCPQCKGKVHTQEHCPNRWQSTNKAWRNFSHEQKAQPCVHCGGIGHCVFMHSNNEWRQQQHIIQQNANAECFSCPMGTCTLGEKCRFAHPSGTEGTPVDQYY